jgi:hypothetical protein
MAFILQEIFVGLSLSASKKQTAPYTSGSVHDSTQTLFCSCDILSSHTLTAAYTKTIN